MSKAAATNLGPTFERVDPQPHPGRKVHDLGARMCWCTPRRTARLYRNIRDHAPYAFTFDCVLVHEEDAPDSFYYDAALARKTSVGMFYPLSSCLLWLYQRGEANRDIFAALAELDKLMPPERRVTDRDAAHFCKTLGKGEPLPPEPRPALPTGVLAADLEIQGFRLTNHLPREGRCLLSICWTPRPDGHRFYVGTLELRPTKGGLVGQWMRPGPCGVNQLLVAEFQKLCEGGPAACLTRDGHKACLSGITPLSGKPAKQLYAWPETPFQPALVATSSSRPSRTKSGHG